MFHDIIKEKLMASVSRTVSNLEQFVLHPGRDFTRNRKLPVFTDFVHSTGGLDIPGKYRYPAADGSSLTFGRDDSPESAAYHVSEGHSKKGCNSMHLNAFCDLDTRTYTDALLQPVHEKDEFRAFCTMAGRSSTPDGTSTVFIGDRGYASYNNIAHVIEKGQYFLFRTKDTEPGGY